MSLHVCSSQASEGFPVEPVGISSLLLLTPYSRLSYSICCCSCYSDIQIFDLLTFRRHSCCTLDLAVIILSTSSHYISVIILSTSSHYISVIILSTSSHYISVIILSTSSHYISVSVTSHFPIIRPFFSNSAVFSHFSVRNILFGIRKIQIRELPKPLSENVQGTNHILDIE